MVGRKRISMCCYFCIAVSGIIIIFWIIDLGRLQKDVKRTVSSIYNMKIVLGDTGEMVDGRVMMPRMTPPSRKIGAESLNKEDWQELEDTKDEQENKGIMFDDFEEGRNIDENKEIGGWQQQVHVDRLSENIDSFDKPNSGNADTDRLIEKYLETQSVNVVSYANVTVKDYCYQIIIGKYYRICLFHRQDDPIMFRSLITEQNYQKDAMESFILALRDHLGTHFIDLGSGLGVYSLTAAMFGRKVLAVEPYYRAVRKFRESIVKNGLQSNITLLANVINEEKGFFRAVDGSVSSAKVYRKETASKVYPSELATYLVVPSISIIKLIPFIKFKRAILRLDLGEHDADIIINARTLLAGMDIPYIFMNWNNVRSSPKLNNMMLVLLNRGYRPKKNLNGDSHEMGAHLDWGNTVIWIKSKTF